MPATEPRLTTWPPSRMYGRQRRVMRISPWTFVSSTVSSSCSLPSQNGSRPRLSPALLTRMSSAPSSPIAASANRSQQDRSRPEDQCGDGKARERVEAIPAREQDQAPGGRSACEGGEIGGHVQEGPPDVQALAARAG